jgi:hypothetical protein
VPARRARGRRVRGRRVDAGEVARQPVLVQSCLAADRREASPRRDPRQDERRDVRVPVAAGDLGGDLGEVPVGAAAVRPRDDLPGCLRQRLPGFPAALLGEGTAPRRRGGRQGQFAPPRSFPARGGALADRRLERQPGREKGRPDFPCLRPFQRLAALQAERQAVLLLRPPMRGQVGDDRPQRPPAQVADHPRPVRDDLAERGVVRRPVLERPVLADHRGGHAVSWRLASHYETTSARAELLDFD